MGGAADDTYSATQATLTAGDQLNGGAGTDTLSITSTGGALGDGVVSRLVENIRVTATAATTVNGAQFDDVVAVENTGSTATGTVEFTNLKAVPAINVNATNSNTTVGFAAGVGTGAADAATVNLTSSASVGSVSVTANGIETLNVVAAGTSGADEAYINGALSTGRTVTVASNTLGTLNVTGSGTARISADLRAATNTVTGTVTSDAGAHDITVIADAGDKVSVSMGAGDDVVRIGAIGTLTGSTTSGGWTVAGGDGTDTLVWSTGSSSISGANISDFEAARMGAAATVWMDASKNDVRTVTFDTAGGSFTGLESGGTVNLPVGGSATVANTDVSTTGWNATASTSDSLTVNVGTSSTSGALASGNASISASGVETITITNLAAAGDITARTNTVSGSSVKALTVSSAGALTLSAGSTALTSVNASGVAGNLSYTNLAATAGASVTGGAGNDTITSTATAGADTINGGAGTDSISGGGGNDSLLGGDGADTIVGGNGADNLTGGAGADRFVFATNDVNATTAVVTSTASTTDTITDFVSGTDKIEITGAGAPVAFLGNFTNISAALAASNAGVNTGVLQNSAAYVTGENTLYVFRNNDGTSNINDMVIRLSSAVTTLAGTDLLLGAQSSGNDITIDTTTVANVTNSLSTGASATSGVTTNTPLETSATTTINNDTVRITTARLGVAATIDGGAGNDTLTVSNSSTATPSTAAYTVTLPTTVTGFEVFNLPNAQTTNSSFTFVAQNFTNNRTHFISASNHLGVDGAGADLGNVALTIDAGAATVSQVLSITGGAGNDSIRGGDGNDTISGGAGADTIDLQDGGRDSVDGGAGADTITGAAGIDTINGGDGDDSITLGAAGSVVTGGTGSDTFTTSVANAAGSSFTGGTGTSDAITFSDAGTVILAAAVDSTTTPATGLISQIEVINLNDGGANTASSLTVTPGQNLTVVQAAGALTLAGTGNTITITGSAARNATLSGTSNFVISGQTTGTVSSTGTGSLVVTSTAAHTVSATGAATVNVAALVTADNTTGLTVGGVGGTITVTGAGTTANDLITEATTFTGSLTVNTVDTNAVLVTQASTAASAGAFILNATDGANGTGLVTLTALANHASQTINMTGGGAANAGVAVTVAAASTATAYTVSSSGTGTFTYVSDTNTAAVDTYTGGVGVDDITPSLGADIISLGTGAADIVRITADGDTALAVGILAGAAVPANGTQLNVSGMDKISQIGAGDTIVFSQGTASTVNTTGYTIIRNGQTIGANTTNDIVMLTGNYDATTGIFTVSLAGTSTLLCYDTNGDEAGGDYRGVVLVGYVDNGAVDTVVGTGTTSTTFTVVGG